MSLGSIRCTDDEIINVIKELKPLSDPKYEQNDEIKSGIMASKPYDEVLDEVAVKRLAGDYTKQEEDKSEDNDTQQDYFKSNKSGILGGST